MRAASFRFYNDFLRSKIDYEIRSWNYFIIYLFIYLFMYLYKKKQEI